MHVRYRLFRLISYYSCHSIRNRRSWRSNNISSDFHMFYIEPLYEGMYAWSNLKIKHNPTKRKFWYFEKWKKHAISMRHVVALTMMNVSVGKGINRTFRVLRGCPSFYTFIHTHKKYFLEDVWYISLINEVFNYFSSARALFF